MGLGDNSSLITCELSFFTVYGESHHTYILALTKVPKIDLDKERSQDISAVASWRCLLASTYLD